MKMSKILVFLAIAVGIAGFCYETTGWVFVVEQITQGLLVLGAFVSYRKGK